MQTVKNNPSSKNSPQLLQLTLVYTCIASVVCYLGYYVGYPWNSLRS